MSLAEAFPGELARCRELIQAYSDIGLPGAFGALMIGEVIRRAEKAQAEQDVVAMATTYREMQGCE